MKETKAERMGETILVKNPTCLHCGNDSEIRVDWLKYQMWQGGGLIDRIFPEMSAGQREMMISGTHPFCWKEMFDESEEDDVR